MNFIKQLERIQKMHQLIATQTTGNPSRFAQKLRISRSQLYNELEHLKELDAPIQYCKKKESFCYTRSFELKLSYSLQTIVEGEARKIFGGFDFRPILLDGTMFTLP